VQHIYKYLYGASLGTSSVDGLLRGLSTLFGEARLLGCVLSITVQGIDTA